MRSSKLVKLVVITTLAVVVGLLLPSCKKGSPAGPALDPTRPPGTNAPASPPSAGACREVWPVTLKSRAAYRSECVAGRISPAAVQYLTTCEVFRDLGSADRLCDLLSNKLVLGPCPGAMMELATLFLNIFNGNLSWCNCIDSPLTPATTVGDAIIDMVGRLLLSPTPATCQWVQDLASSINTGDVIVPCDVPECVPGGDPWADFVLNFQAGSGTLHGTPDDSLGPADTVPPDPSTLASLGVGGAIEVQFSDNYVTDGPGADFRIYEGTFGAGATMENARFYVAEKPGDPFIPITPVSVSGSGIFVAEFDLATVGLTEISVVRIEDDGDMTSGGNGFDVDAVEAINSCVGSGPGRPNPPPPDPGDETGDDDGTAGDDEGTDGARGGSLACHTVGPKKGPVSGGNRVSISGKGFSQVTGVTFNGVSASFSVNNPSVLNVWTPPCSGSCPGTAEIVVSTDTDSCSLRYSYR